MAQDSKLEFSWTDSASSVKRIWRSLDTTEALFATFNAAGAFLIAQAIEIHGPLTESLLLQALTHLEKRHPLLRARIVPYRGSLYWAKGVETRPRISIIEQVPPGGLAALMEAELHRTYRADRERLWRCTWIPISAERHWIVLALHHSVADGLSNLVIARDLLATCSALLGAGGLPPELAPGRTLDQVLPPVSRLALLRHRTMRLRSRLFGPQALLPIERTAPPQQRRTGVIFGSVPGELMLALRAAARSHGATINGVLAAAVLEAVRRTLGPLPVVPVTHTVSMRGAAIPRQQVGCFTTSVVTLHPVRKCGSFWSEAQSATEQLHRALERGYAAAALLATRGKIASSAAAMRAAIEDPRTAGRIGAINLGNRGLTSDLSAGPFRVAAWHPAVSNHVFGSGVQVSCATVGETFFFSLMHVVPLLSVASARHVTDRFVDCLVRESR